MSENLDPEQDIRGLVAIQGITLNNFKIEDNVIQAYLPSSNNKSETELSIYPGIRSLSGKSLQTEYQTTIRLHSTHPEVRLIGKGIIVPDNNKVLFLSIIGLKAVDLEIIQVLNQKYELFLSGKFI